MQLPPTTGEPTSETSPADDASSRADDGPTHSDGKDAASEIGTATDAGSNADADAGVCPVAAAWDGPYDLPDGVCSVDGICSSSHSPLLQGLKHVWASSETDVWMTGNGSVLHWDGTKWRGLTGINRLNFPTSGPSIAASSPSDVWLGGFLHWDGMKLSKAAKPAPSYVSSMWLASANDGWAVDGSLLAFRWNGSNWTSVATGAAFPLRRVRGFASNDVWAIGDSVRHWDGVTWGPAPAPLPVSASYSVIDGASGADLWLGTSMSLHHLVGGVLVKYAIDGVTAIHASATDDVTFVIGPTFGKPARLAHWNGTDISDDAPGSSDCEACGSCTSVFKLPGGTQFLTTTSALASTPRGCPAPGLSSVTLDTAIAVGTTRIVPYAGKALRVASGKLYYDDAPVPLWGLTSDDVALDVSVNGTDAWVTGRSGTTHFASRFDGTAWSSSPLPYKPTTRVAATSSLSAWVLMGGRAAYWNGTSWVDKGFVPLGAPAGIWGSSETDCWAVGHGIAHWNGTAWSTFSLTPEKLVDVYGSSATDIVALMIDHSKAELHRWNGAAWSMVAGSQIVGGSGGGNSSTSFAFVATNDIWHAAGGQGNLDHWDGACWRRVTGATAYSPGLPSVGASGATVFLATPAETLRVDRTP